MALADLHITPGCFHASEVFVPAAPSSGRILAARVEALQRAFDPAGVKMAT